MPKPEGSPSTPPEAALEPKNSCKQKIELRRPTESNEMMSGYQKMIDRFNGLDTYKVLEIYKKDRVRLNHVIHSIKTDTTIGTLARAIGGVINPKRVSSLVSKVDYDHEAILLVVPEPIICDWLVEAGFEDAETFPSTIVKDRLEKRHGIKCPTKILKASIEITDPDDKDKKITRQIEIFMPNPPEKAWGLDQIKFEQEKNPESHTAFAVKKNFSIEEVIEEFLNKGLKQEEGGSNPNEKSTTLYFVNKEGVRSELITKTDTEPASSHSPKQNPVDIVKF